MLLFTTLKCTVLLSTALHYNQISLLYPPPHLFTLYSVFHLLSLFTPLPLQCFPPLGNPSIRNTFEHLNDEQYCITNASTITFALHDSYPIQCIACTTSNITAQGDEVYSKFVYNKYLLPQPFPTVPKSILETPFGVHDFRRVGGSFMKLHNHIIFLDFHRDCYVFWNMKNNKLSPRNTRMKEMKCLKKKNIINNTNKHTLSVGFNEKRLTHNSNVQVPNF